MDASTTRPGVGRVTLKPVGADDWRDVAGLVVSEAQRAFVAELAYYLTMCAYGGVWNPLAVRLDERVIGLVMWAVDPEDGSCWLGGLIVDVGHQRQGHGRRAVEAAMALLGEAYGHRRFARSHHPDNPAKRSYHALGFQETGEVEGNEVVARLSLP